MFYEDDGDKIIKFKIKKDAYTFNIPRFDMRKMGTSPIIAIISKRGSGKSWIVRDILYNFRDIPVGMIISPTDKLNSFYSSFCDDIYIHSNYSGEIVERLLSRQAGVKNSDRYKDIDKRCFLVMDDCLSDKKQWETDDKLNNIITNGRHFDITFILTLQYVFGVGPLIRSNVDYVFLLADNNAANIKKFYESFASSFFQNHNIFLEVFCKLTKDYTAMVISNRTSDQGVYWYKSVNPPDEWKIGSKQFKQFAENNTETNKNARVLFDRKYFFDDERDLKKTSGI